MKKQRFFMLGIITVLVAVLSLTFVSSTFAKYTTSDTAKATARVAKWGVKVAVEGETAFATAYEGTVGSANTVKSSTDERLVAPGTAGTLGSISITGKPEVMVDIKVVFDLELSNWTAASCPLIFTVNDVDYKIGDAGIADEAALEAKIEALVNALSAEKVAPNTDLARSISVSWRWEFSGNDTNDTALGNQATAPTISADWSATVEQVD